MGARRRSADASPGAPAAEAGRAARGTLVAEYRRPAALMVPHCRTAVTGLLEEIAVEAAAHVGVILLSETPEASADFVAAQAHAERFSIVAAPFDTPWIRDRSPIAVRVRGGYRWVMPRLPDMERPLDDALFERIAGREVTLAPIELPHGNLVAGPDGLALITQRAVESVDAEVVEAAAPALGVRRWVVIPAFENEATGHADVHARFLAPDLLAVAWSEDDPRDRRCARVIEQRADAVRPGVRLLHLPMRSDGDHYASPVNWIQIGRRLLVPRYDLTPAADLERIEAALREAGFRPMFIHSPTLEHGGSLHCLTASIYV